MAGNLTAVVRADTSGFAEEIKAARYMVNKFTQDMKQNGSSISGVCNAQVQAYNNVIKGLEKVANGSKTTKQAQKELQNQIQELKIQWANLSNEARSGDFGKSLADSLKVAKTQLKILNQQLDQTSDKIGKVSSKQGVGFDFGNVKNSISSVADSMSSLGIQGGGVLQTLTSAGGALVNPYTAAAAAVAGATYAVIDFNKTLSEQVNKVQELTGANAEAATAIRSSVVSIADAYEQDFDEVLIATNSLAKQMGISFTEATDAIALGMASGANANGELLETIKEYPAYLKEAGVDATGFMAIISTSVKEGVFSDKGVDAIKEANLRLREMPQATQDALNAIGLSSNEISKALSDGSKSTFEIIQQVSKKLKELPPASKEVGQAIADIFGGPGEDAGLQYLQMLGDIELSEESLIAKMTEQEKATYNLQKADEDLQNSLASLFGVSEGGWQTMTTQLKADVYKAIAKVVNGFIDLYNKSTLVRSGIQSIALQFKTAWNVIKGICKQFVISLEGIADVVEDIISGNWGKVASDANKALQATSKNFDDISTTFLNDVRDAFKEIKNGEIKHIKVEVDTVEGSGSSSTKRSGGSKKSGSGSSSGKSKNKKVKEPKELSGLAELENKASEVEKKLKNLPLNADPTELKTQLKDLKEQIKKQKIKLGLEIDEEAVKKAKAISDAQKKSDKVVEKGVEKKKTSSFDSASAEAEIEANKELGIVKKQTTEEELEGLKETMDALDEYITKLKEARAEMEANGDISSDSYKKNTEALKEATNSLSDNEKKTKKLIKEQKKSEKQQDDNNEKLEEFNKTSETIGAVGDCFSTLGNAIGGTEGKAISLFGSVLNGITQIIPQIGAVIAAEQAETQASQQLTVAKEGEAIAKGTASASGAPWFMVIPMIASVVGTIIGIFSSIGSFADGGIISGKSKIGDMNIARVNGGEMILNGTQQAKLFRMLNVDGTYNTVGTSTVALGTVKVKGSDLYLALSNYKKKSVKNKQL